MRLHPDDIKAIAEQVAALISGKALPTLPSTVSSNAARLITLARLDPEAAKAEARRIAAADRKPRGRAHAA